MSTNYKEISSDDMFQPELNNAGIKLVVVDFYATWCGPCQKIKPFYKQLSAKYPNAVFLKVDVDVCQETAMSNNVSAMPTFIFLRNKVKIDELKGCNQPSLEEKVKKWYTEEEGEGENLVKGQMDLFCFIDKKGCEILNVSDDSNLEGVLDSKPASATTYMSSTHKEDYLKSDCDEQLIICIAFNQVVKLHSLKIHAPEKHGPKLVKLFINQPRTLDFDSCENMEATQLLDLSTEDLKINTLIPLRYVKFQNVSNITLFVKSNQIGDEISVIDHLAFIGSPATTTNMADFKRIAGKKGESH